MRNSWNQVMLFRTMTPDTDGQPHVSRAARGLGVRVPQDIQPDASGHVVPDSGGMSVAPNGILNLPNHRRPRAFGYGSTGPNEDRIYWFTEDNLRSYKLSLQPDRACHATIGPERKVLLRLYEQSLAATREEWRIAWQTP